MNEEDRACALGRVEQMIRHAVWSSGCSGLVIGISGGVDSAVAAAMCCRALGGSRVLGLTLPTHVTTPEDIEDASALCRQLSMEHRTIPIDPILESYRTLPGYREDRFLEGNLMARTRMAILYYYANLEGRLVCGTSNRTEYLIGYCTKHGDSAADIQPIIHLYKTEVYQAARDLEIPDTIIAKSPTAGLWAGQTDEDELGLTYPEIDDALKALQANGWKSTNPVEERVLSLVQKSEHKRLDPPSLLGRLQVP
ncbi:MAG: NAD+ synthase [Methanoregulaceae archaeon]|nr:NAD+ synthase [Methanoregulaceae archaeon]MDD5049818.1 NAD+ synthase [Methanoregulaceae archaeon]MDD5685389.1 NAD+ synthase [Methanoregulaceae archaeon]HRX33771.1 NAD+ synthase [Methanoregulaceae archaeon]